MTPIYTRALFAPAATWPTTGDGAVHALLFLRSFTTGRLLAQMQVEWLLTGGPWRMLRIIRAGLRFLVANSLHRENCAELNCNVSEQNVIDGLLRGLLGSGGGDGSVIGARVVPRARRF